MNPFIDPALVEGYEAWYTTEGSRADIMEKALLRQLLLSFPATKTLLEVGCGTGHFTRWFADQGLNAVGLDIAAPMLREAARLQHVPYLRGDGAALPFATGAFDVVALITTLEFVAAPVQVLAEALRVARRGLILGVLNGQSLLAWKLTRQGGPIWTAARFYTPATLIKTVEAAAGREPSEPPAITWHTTVWPAGAARLPWGQFISMGIHRR